jgi:NADH:ubiquinone oxidoreductase subunit H
MVSSELPMTMVVLTLTRLVRDGGDMHSLAMSSLLVPNQYVAMLVPLWPVALIWFVHILAETKRAPFDLPEALSEMVAGYNAEYSSMGFALFFLAEYATMAVMSASWSVADLMGCMRKLAGLRAIGGDPSWLWWGGYLPNRVADPSWIGGGHQNWHGEASRSASYGL